MSMRKKPKEIQEGILKGFQEEARQDLTTDFEYDVEPAENRTLLLLCAQFLHSKSLDEYFGWQDFDILISEKFGGRWESALAYGAQVIGEEIEDIEDARDRVAARKKFDAMTDEELVASFASRPNVQMMTARDARGGVVVFSNLQGIADIRRV